MSSQVTACRGNERGIQKEAEEEENTYIRRSSLAPITPERARSFSDNSYFTAILGLANQAETSLLTTIPSFTLGPVVASQYTYCPVCT